MSSGPDPFAPGQPPAPRPSLYFPSTNGGTRPPFPTPLQRKPRLWLHVLLFALTAVTTTWANGPVYSACLMAILTAHEFGHYFLARRHGVKATLPYFIPSPTLLGTFGAVIRMSPYIPSRRALFDIAAAGPIAGVVVAIPVCIIGVGLSEYVPEATSGGIQLGDPLLFRLLEWVMFPTRPDGAQLFLHPVAFAGWVGLFVTALNLLPISQLDGGHISYALLGRRASTVAGAAFAGLAIMTVIQGYHYTLILLLLWFMGLKHPPTLNDSVSLGRERRIVAGVLVVIFVLSFVPAPISL